MLGPEMVEDFKETVFSQITEQLHTGTHGSDDGVHRLVHTQAIQNPSMERGEPQSPAQSWGDAASDGYFEGKSRASLLVYFLAY